MEKHYLVVGERRLWLLGLAIINKAALTCNYIWHIGGLYELGVHIQRSLRKARLVYVEPNYTFLAISFFGS